MKLKLVKNYDEFLKYVTKLEPIEFLGVTQVLCVKLQDENGADRKFEDIFIDVLVGFQKLPRNKRRDLLKVVKNCATHKLNLKEDEQNAS